MHYSFARYSYNFQSEQKLGKAEKRENHVEMHPTFSSIMNSQIHAIKKLVQYAHKQLTQKQ
jgi:hypothetical protein